MAKLSDFIISDEQWQSMSEAERLEAISRGELSSAQMQNILEKGSEDLKKAVQQFLVDAANRAASLESTLDSALRKSIEEYRLPTYDFQNIAAEYLSESEADLGQTVGPYRNEPQELDELLGLYRRGAFDRDLTECTAASEQVGEPLALVMVDLDKFKAINDAHGHPAGDEVLQSVARTIKKTVGKKGASYRYGGEELSILLPNYSADEAASLAERIRQQIETSQIGSKALHVTASFGVAEVPTHANTAAELLKMADSALYEAKDLGRNLVRISGESKPVASMSRVTARRQPDPSSLTEQEAKQIRAEHFRYYNAFCPRDGSRLRIQEVDSDERVTPDLLISCPFCGLSDASTDLGRAEAVNS